MYAGEVSVDAMTVFGIEISTRHGKAYELAEMINFCVALERRGLKRKVVSVFYDSNSCCCSFEISRSVERYGDSEQGIFEAAKETISQFDWFGTVKHGEPLERG